MHDGQRNGETRPDGVREDRGVGEKQERGWDIAARQGGSKDGDNQVHGNAGDGREHADGKGGAVPGGDAVGVTVAAS